MKNFNSNFNNSIGKSNIQLEQEKIEKIYKYQEYVRALVEKYDLQGAAFSANCQEVFEGYLDIEKEYDNVEEALKGIESLDCTLYFDGEYIAKGIVKKTIAECNNDKIIDIYNFRKVTK